MACWDGRRRVPAITMVKKVEKRRCLDIVFDVGSKNYILHMGTPNSPMQMVENRIKLDSSHTLLMLYCIIYQTG